MIHFTIALGICMQHQIDKLPVSLKGLVAVPTFATNSVMEQLFR